MLLNELTAKREQIVSNETIWRAYLKKIKYVCENALFAYYSINEIADAIRCELTSEYSAADVRRSLVWAKVNNYGPRSGFEYLTYKNVLKAVSKEAARPIEIDEFRQEITDLLGENK